QVGTHRIVIQRVGDRAGTESGKGVPWRAAGDHVARRAAHDLAGGRVQERGAQRVAQVGLVQVARADLAQLVLVVQIARIPVEIAVADLEHALQGRGEAPGGQLGAGDARVFPGTATPFQVASVL